MTTSGRLLELLSLLQARRDWPGAELADRLECSQRTVRRDVERLRALGYPVESLTGPSGGYRLAAGAAMPPLLLDDEEAVAIAVGLRTSAGAAVSGIEETSIRALVKLEQVLPAHLRRRVEALDAATVTTTWTGGPEVAAEALMEVAAACRDHVCLRFAYTAREGAESRREVEPLSLVNMGRRWYLVAWDRGRAGWRTFRMDRISEATVGKGGRFTPRKLPGGDPAAYVKRSVSRMVYRYEARVTIGAPAADVRAALPWVAQGRIEPDGPDRCVYVTSDDHVEWLAQRVGMLDFEDVRIEGPPELFAQLHKLADRFARAAASA